MQFVIFTVTKIIILRGSSATPKTDFTKGRHIIIANHSAALDPFAIVSSLRFRDFFRLAPFSFMTANVFMKPLWLRPFAWLAGCFPAHPGLGPYGIQKAVLDVNNGYTLLIFPEGKRSKGMRIPAKHGIITILDQIPDSNMLFVHIKWKSTSTTHSIRVAYKRSNHIYRSPDEIMDEIYDL